MAIKPDLRQAATGTATARAAPRAPWRRRRGMSLIEVLVSLAVCGLLLAVMLPAGSAALERQRFSQLQVQAHSLAAQKVELLSAWPAALPLPSEGTEGRLRWSVREILIVTAGANESSAASLRHFTIKIEAVGQASPLLDLRIQRLSDLAGSARAVGETR